MQFRVSVRCSKVLSSSNQCVVSTPQSSHHDAKIPNNTDSMHGDLFWRFSTTQRVSGAQDACLRRQLLLRPTQGRAGCGAPDVAAVASSLCGERIEFRARRGLLW